jgi:hypothetical protein
LLPNTFGVAGTLNQRLRTYNPTKTRTNKPTKKSWHDELVGLTAEEAKRKINRPVQVVPQGYHVTFDYKPGRVRLYVDESNKVVHITFG